MLKLLANVVHGLCRCTVQMVTLDIYDDLRHLELPSTLDVYGKTFVDLQLLPLILAWCMAERACLTAATAENDLCPDAPVVFVIGGCI
jgi:hypothetical protein